MERQRLTRRASQSHRGFAEVGASVLQTQFGLHLNQLRSTGWVRTGSATTRGRHMGTHGFSGSDS
jgi:hypothetical protein